MATEFPAMEPELPMGPEDTEGVIVDLGDISTDPLVEELPDGSAIVTLEEEGEDIVSGDFLQNLAESLDSLEMNVLATKYLDFVEKDREDRQARDKQYEEGLKRTGLGNDAPGGAQFQGASRVVHPIMAEACIDFESRAIKELFPPDGPVRTHVIGKATQDKTEVAERKRDYMNWQLTSQIEEYKDEMEQMLTQLPLGGSQYLKMWYDPDKRRPCAEFIPIDNMLLPFAAANFYTASRASEVNDITQEEFERRVDSGLYIDADFTSPSMEPESSGPQRANNKIEGKEFSENFDGLRRVYHIYTFLRLDADPKTKGVLAPYILMVDETTRKTVGLYRNWEEGDESFRRLDWMVEFKFIPWRGAYAVGFPHLIGGMAAALTGALRALLDSAHINNAATMLKLKGARMSGQTTQVEVTQVAEIESAPGVDDIRKVAMPMPFNPPSPVLYQLLGWLTDAAKGVVTTSEEKIADITSNAPVGTTQALIEQGAAVFSAIHARLHGSQARVLQILARLNRWYFDEMDKEGVSEELSVEREDFKKNTDILPVSDPHIFSETQRMAQNQAVIALDKQYPGVMDPKAIVKRTLRQLKIADTKELMPNAPEPHELNAAEENVTMSLGRPSFAYPHQDHLAHISTHIAYGLNPMFGSNPIMVPAFMSNAIEHIKQHMMLWYSQSVNEAVSQAGGDDLNDYKDNPRMTAQVDRVVDLATKHVNMDSQQKMGQIMQALQQMSQVLAQYAKPPEPVLDAASKVLLDTSMAETNRRAQRDQAEITLEAKKLQDSNVLKTKDQQIKVALNAIDNLTDERMAAAEMTNDAKILQTEQQATALDLLNSTQANLGGNPNGNY